MIVLINGAFGIGKTTVARLVARRLPGAAIYDPEPVGIVLQRLARMAGRDVVDFQDLRVWRRLTIVAVRLLGRVRRHVIVPMAFSNDAYLREIRAGVGEHVHVCLVAPLDVVLERQAGRKRTPADAAWQERRAAECCAAHHGESFATHVDAASRDANAIADDIVRLAAR